MMQNRSPFAVFLIAASGLAGLGTFAAPAEAAGAVKSAYVQAAIPTRTFFKILRLTDANVSNSAGAGEGTLGITSLTLSNRDSAQQRVYMFIPTPGGCDGSPASSYGPPMVIEIPPLQTVHLAFPTPLVMYPDAASTCIAASLGTNSLHATALEIYVNGVIN